MPIEEAHIKRNDDNWAYRSQEMRCSTCMWYSQKRDMMGDMRHSIGRCRRRAPTMNGFPVVFGSDWCGDHKIDEGRV